MFPEILGRGSTLQDNNIITSHLFLHSLDVFFAILLQLPIPGLIQQRLDKDRRMQALHH